MDKRTLLGVDDQQGGCQQARSGGGAASGEPKEAKGPGLTDANKPAPCQIAHFPNTITQVLDAFWA